MKSIFKINLMVLLICSSFLVFAQQAKAPKVQTIQIKTSAICEQCQERIQHGLLGIKGVKSAHLDNDTKVVTVVYRTAKTNPDALRKAISAMGYDADDVKRNEEAFKALPGCCQVKMH